MKYGGNALAGGSEADALELFAQDIVLMRSVGMRPVVVHGGGPQISELMNRLGKVPEFRNGLRVTDAETVDIARMVLRGQVNPRLVAAINVHGALAVGVSGEDAGLISATPAPGDLGFVGQVGAINPTILERLLNEDLIPVVATIGTDAVRAGVQHQRRHRGRRHRRRAARRRSSSTSRTSKACAATSTIPPASSVRRRRASSRRSSPTARSRGGMIPKVESCIAAVRRGVGRAHILDGRVPHVLLLEIFTDAGIGTMVTVGDTPPGTAAP